MNRSEVLQEVRKMRFEEAHNQFRSRRLSCEEAAELLGSSVSTFTGIAAVMRKRVRRD